MSIILLSGGIDSALCLHRYGAELAVGFDYGQPHKIELIYARKIAAHYCVKYEQYTIKKIPLVNDIMFAGRNAVLLSFAASLAHSYGISRIIIGCNLSDSHRFSDCRSSFINSMDEAIYDAYGIHVYAPLLSMTKAQIITEARAVGLPETWTCYSPTITGERCGQCYSCEEIKSC